MMQEMIRGGTAGRMRFEYAEQSVVLVWYLFVCLVLVCLFVGLFGW
jgi:hypothetical protein